MSDQHVDIEARLRVLFARHADEVPVPTALPSSALRRITMHKFSYAAMAVAVVAMSAVIAAAALGDSSEPQFRPIEQGPQEMQRLDLDELINTLEPGRYVADRFDPPFSFTVDSGRNVRVSGSYQDNIMNFMLGGASVQLSVADQVFDPVRRELTEAPDDLIGWLEQHPMLETEPSMPVTIGGAAGESIEILIDRALEHPICNVGVPPDAQRPCLPLFDTGSLPGVFSLSEGWSATIAVVEVDGVPVTVTTFDLRRARPDTTLANSFIETIEFES